MVKRKIALVIDTDNWAFKTTAKMIKKGLDKYYNVDIFTLEYLNANLVKFFLIFEDYDLIHFLWREPLVNLIKPHFEEYTWLIGSDRDTFIKEKINFNKITVGVYDHLFLDEDFYKTKYIFSKIKRYCVSSKKLFRIYNQLDVKYHPTCVINDGIDTNKFIPRNLERFNSFKRDIVTLQMAKVI